ncbi:class I SAM-dependent methyltransferase [Allokutzneria albata]|uniref:Phospholipid N-methyltransferase n=1 Tax=Allokutzneria albata TaxID=211114 RepID=A0A1G9RWP2_ALLAB|nr:methyltransferase domain-containing protein [Allokutzneria albata]SDM27651.1 Phospholipid N-methyltransferase [Allokutzneria albata]
MSRSWEFVPFVLGSLRRPISTGAFVPSSRGCARALLDGIDMVDTDTVVELGAGTGAITRALDAALPASARLLAVEINDGFAERLRRTAPPRVEVVCDSAVELPRILDEHRVERVDAVVSALPWTVMRSEDRRAVLTAVAKVLQPEGVFATLLSVHRARTDSGREFESLLADTFTEVRRGRTIWTNLPPVTAYHCT